MSEVFATFDWGTLVTQFMNYGLFGGLLWAIKRLIDKIEDMGRRLTIIETEHAMLREWGQCPLEKIKSCSEEHEKG